METAPKKPNKRRYSRRKGAWRKFLSVLLTLGVIFVVFAIIGLLTFQHLYKNRSDFAERYLNHIFEGHQVEFDAIEIANLGEVEIKNLRIRQNKQSTVFVTAEELLISYDFRALRNHRQVKDVVIKSPKLRFEQSFFKAAEKGAWDQPFAPAVFDYVTGKISIEDAQILIDHPNIAVVQATGSVQVPKLEFDKNSGRLVKPIECTIENVQIGERGVFGKIAEITTEFDFKRDLSAIAIGRLHIVRPNVRLFPEWFSLSKNTGGEILEFSGIDVTLDKLEIIQLQFASFGFDSKRGDSGAIIPNISFTSDVIAWAGLSYKKNRFESKGALNLAVEQLAVGRGREKLLEASRAEFHAGSLADVVHRGKLNKAAGDNVKVVISNKSLSLWANRESSKNTNHYQFNVGELDLPDAQLTIVDYQSKLRAINAPVISTSIDTLLKDLIFDRSGLKSKQIQNATLRNFAMAGPDGTAEDPLLKFSKGDLSLNWDAFTTECLVESLTIDSPDVLLTDSTAGTWAGLANSESIDAPAKLPNMSVYRVKNLAVENGSFHINSTKLLDGRVPRVHGKFSISNDQIGQELGEYGYRLRLNDLHLKSHESLSQPPADTENASLFPSDLIPRENDSEEVVKVDDMVVEFTAEGLQKFRKIKKVHVQGGSLRMGEGFKSVVTPPQELSKLPSPLGVDPISSSLMPELDIEQVPEPLLQNSYQTIAKDLNFFWEIEDLKISDAKVNLESVIPEVDGLSFGLETSLKDIPLSKDGVVDADKLQQIKLDNIRIRDPYDSFLTVADIPDLFVEFSFAGLSEQVIERVDVVGPKLNIGESLFRWVDYLRKYRATNEGAGFEFVGGVRDISEDTSTGAHTNWVINSINATSGKLVVAPYGTPIVSLPFPFNATTNIEEGRLELDMLIPKEKKVYELPDYELELKGLEGIIDFNLPIPDKNNNFVQTFTLKQAKWKKFAINDMFLTVTFDRYGIYGLFGGEAYGGYANGAFNYYLDKDGEWDAWVAGTGLNTAEVTEALIPKSFSMGGKINVKLFTGGKDTKIGDITGEIVTEDEGWFDIKAMEKALERLPENWSSLQIGLSKIAVDSLKRFDYDSGSGELDFGEKDGLLKLRFEGEYGKRNLNLHIHDWKTVPVLNERKR